MEINKHKTLTVSEIKNNRPKVDNIHQLNKQNLSYQEILASKITNIVGSMECAYVFAMIAFISLPDAIKNGTATTISWIAQTFLQLVLLSIIMVGQKVESKRSELKSNQDFEINRKFDSEIEEILKHLENQNQDLYRVLKHIDSKKNNK